MIGSFLHYFFIRRLRLYVNIVSKIEFLYFCGFVAIQQQIVKTLDLYLVLHGDYFFIQFVQEQSTVFYDSPVVGCLKRKQGIKLLNQYADKHVSDIFIMAVLLNF